jgi:hypothetical protein
MAKIEFQIPEKIKVDYRGQEIELIPYLTTGQQVYLINQYVNDYFNEDGQHFITKDKYNYLEAEFNMFSYLIQFLTNIEDAPPNDTYVDSKFLDIFVENVENFDDFCSLLYDTVENIKEQIEIENSIGPVLEGLIKKGYDILEKFQDLTPEEIEKLQEEGKDMLKQLQESSLIKESQKSKKAK